MNEQLLRGFFEDLAIVEDQAADGAREVVNSPNVPTWVASEDAVAALREALTRPQHADALAEFVKEMVHTALHAALVAIDGGSASAEFGDLDLVDGSGRSLGDGLHEKFVEYLFDTGRMD